MTATFASSLFAVDAPPTQTPSTPPVAAPQTPAPQTSTPQAQTPAPVEPIRLVLTRLDVVHEGVVRDRGDVLSIELLDGGSVAVSKLDVRFVGATREEIFAFQKSRTRLEDVSETLRLADWANRRRLAPQAIALLETKLAEPLSDGERRAVAAKLAELRQAEKLRASAAQTLAARRDASTSGTLANADSAADAPPQAPEIAEIESWAKTLPLSAFDRFGRRVQPIVQKRCGAADCHDGSNPNSAFRVRPKAIGAQARLALYFNLRETFDFIDFNNPAQSPILNHPPVADALGNRVYPFGEDRNSAKDYQAFVAWIESLNDGKLGRYVHRQSRVRDASAAPLRPNAVSRYDRVETPNGYAASPTGNVPTPTNPNPFAGLFDASPPNAAPSVPPSALPGTAPNSPPNVAAASDGFVLRSGTPREARRYLPNPADDPNSTENVLKRGGYAPKRQYRDEYDPAIFNAAAPGAPARY
ncbi:MAG: hypothetical protein IJ991_11950 [Thermoguttaceae bacterium]|nr:hypothetical protein [Thermoguttaceae bacterium]